MIDFLLGIGVAALGAFTLGVILSRNSFFQYDRDIWLKLVIGVIFLDITTLIHFLTRLGYAEGIPILGDEIIRTMVTGIFLIGGSLFILSALVVWLPELLQAIPRLRRLCILSDLALNIQQTCSWRIPTSDTIEKVAGQVFQSIKPSQLVYMKWDKEKKVLTPVHRLPKNLSCQPVELPEIENIDWLHETIRKQQPTRKVFSSAVETYTDTLMLYPQVGDVVVTLPVKANGNLFGVMVILLPSENLFELRDVEMLQIGLNSIAGSMEYSSLHNVAERIAVLKDSHSRLLRIALESNNLDDLLTDGLELFKAFVPFDMLSVCVLDENLGAMRRFSIIESGKSVSEKGISLPVHETAIEHVAQTRSTNINNELTSMTYRDDAWLSKCGFGSRLSVPVFIGCRVVGVISFASIAQDKYDEKWMAAAEILAEIFAVTIDGSLTRDKLVFRTNQIKSSWELLWELTSTGNTQGFFDNFVRHITAGMPVTYCRLSTHNAQTNTLCTIAEHNRRDKSESNQSGKRKIPLDKIPRHRLAIESDKVQIVNQTDPDDNMSDEEAKLCFPDKVQSAIIIPLMVNGNIRGVLTLGEMRERQRKSFSADDLSFAQIMGTLASLALSSVESRTMMRSLRKKLEGGKTDEKVMRAFSDVNRQMAGPLSSIMGTAELMERNLPTEENQVVNFARTIRKNTNAVIKALDDLKRFKNTMT